MIRTIIVTKINTLICVVPFQDKGIASDGSEANRVASSTESSCRHEKSKASSPRLFSILIEEEPLSHSHTSSLVRLTSTFLPSGLMDLLVAAFPAIFRFSGNRLWRFETASQDLAVFLFFVFPFFSPLVCCNIQKYRGNIASVYIYIYGIEG